VFEIIAIKFPGFLNWFSFPFEKVDYNKFDEIATKASSGRYHQHVYAKLLHVQIPKA